MSIDQPWTPSFVEAQILPLTKRLSDGTYGIIFSRNKSEENAHFLYNCHLCSISKLAGENNLKTHIASQTHQNRIDIDFVPNANAFRAQIFIHTKNCTVLASSEKALIGVEHVIEIHDPTLREPFFICSICDKHFDPQVIVSHMISQKHQRNYLERHFKNLLKLLHDCEFFKNNFGYREVILIKIAKKIEAYFGRMKPTIYESDEYKSNKSIINEIMKTRKYWKQEEFEILQAYLIEFCKYEFKKLTSDGGTEKVEENESSMNLDFSIFELPPSSQQISSALPIINNYNIEAELQFREAYNFERFKIAQEKVLGKIEQNYKDYQNKPELHPSYGKEWKIFWHKKYNLLVSDGQDATGYNYKPEWTQFWDDRMAELKTMEITEKLEEIREKLNLTQDELTKFYKIIERENEIKEAERKEQEAKLAAEKAARKKDDEEYRNPGRISCRSFRRRRSSTSESDYSPARIYSSDEDEKKSPINITSVCRLLCNVLADDIFYDQVGKLLETAVKMERQVLNSSAILCEDEENLMFLQSVKMKLIQKIEHNEIVFSNLAKAKQAVKHLDILIFEANKPKPKIIDPAMKLAKEAKFAVSKALAQIIIDKNYVQATPQELSEIVTDLLTSQLEEDDRRQREEEQKLDEEVNIMTDDDLTILLRYFSDLNEKEKEKIMRYIERLHVINPPRLKKLIKYFDIGDDEVDESDDDVEMRDESMAVEG